MNDDTEWYRKGFIINPFVPWFPTCWWWDFGDSYNFCVVERVFPHYHHYHNGGHLKCWVAKYTPVVSILKNS